MLQTHMFENVCSMDTKQGACIICWPAQESVLPRLTQLKRRRGFGKNEGEWTEKGKIRTRKKLLPVVKACVAIIGATPGF